MFNSLISLFFRYTFITTLHDQAKSIIVKKYWNSFKEKSFLSSSTTINQIDRNLDKSIPRLITF